MNVYLCSLHSLQRRDYLFVVVSCFLRTQRNRWCAFAFVPHGAPCEPSLLCRMCTLLYWIVFMDFTIQCWFPLYSCRWLACQAWLNHRHRFFSCFPTIIIFFTLSYHVSQILAILQSGNGRIGLWDSSKRSVFMMETTMKDPTVIRWSKLGPQLAIGTAKGNLVLYNRDSRKLTPVQGKHSKRITCADWSTTTNVLALGGQDNVMTIRCAHCFAAFKPLQSATMHF
jgi:WD40 repeat protein